MKKISLLVLTMALMAGIKAQSVQEVTVEFGDYTVPAYTVSINQSKELTNEALIQRLKESGLKTGKENGYIAVQNQTFTDIYSQPVDFYAKVDEQGKKKNRVTVVTFFAKSPNLTISQNELNINVRRFAEGFPYYVDKFEAQKKVGASEAELKKAQKTQSKAVAAAASIEKDIASDREKIAKKEAEIEKYNKKIESLRADIEKLNASIEKKTGKKAEADEKVNKANEAVQSSESDVNRYRQQVGD
jgi:peptidoglycan hydrolase CwlO-like protein